MTHGDACAECARWFSYLDRQKEKSITIQNLARQAREGSISPDEAKRKLKNIDSCSVTVFDAAKLEKAVRFLVKYSSKDKK